MTHEGSRLRFVAPFRAKTPPHPLTGDIAFLPMDAIGDDGAYDRDSVRSASDIVDSGYTYFEQGDVVRARVTPCFENGKGAVLSTLVGGRGFGTTELFVFDPSSRVDARFLYYAVTSRKFTDEGASTLYGAHGVRRVDDQFVRDYRPWLPDVARQVAIANYLDRETARIDALALAKQDMLALLAEALVSRIEALLLRNATPTRLRRLLVVPPRYGASETGDVDRPAWPRYIRITDLAANGALRNDDVRSLPPTVARAYMLDDWDILFARSGATVGKAFVYRESMGPCCFAGYLIRFRIDRQLILPGLVDLWTRTSHYWSQINAMALQATIENVSAEKYKELLVPVPPAAVQDQILATLSPYRAQMERLQVHILKQIEFLAERRKSLITAAVTGQLDIPEAA